MTGTICKEVFKVNSLNWDEQEEQFQRWKWCQCDEATDIIDPYVLRFKQCAQVLGYKKGWVLEIFKTRCVQGTITCHLLSRILERNLSAKYVITKEKLDKCLEGQAQLLYVT